MKKSKKEEVIWWKVVNKNRRSVIVDRYNTDTSVIDALVLAYNKGEITRAKRGSYGCFCFSNHSEAIQFSSEDTDSFVIRVRPVGIIKPTPTHIPVLKNKPIRYIKDSIKRLKLGKPIEASWKVPRSTVCCTAVEVLD
jgi:hypothetical protein